MFTKLVNKRNYVNFVNVLYRRERSKAERNQA